MVRGRDRRQGGKDLILEKKNRHSGAAHAAAPLDSRKQPRKRVSWDKALMSSRSGPDF